MLRDRRPARLRRAQLAWLAALGVAAAACGSAPPASDYGRLETAIVYGEDDRTELFVQAEDPRSWVADSAVALIPKPLLTRGAAPEIVAGVESSGAAQGLCPGEPFGEQPAAVVCSGVLVDWDLVLTVAHCLESIPLGDLAVVMGFYYVAPGELDTREADVLEPVEVVAQAHSNAAEPYLDYAWIRLARPAPPWRRPASLRAAPRPMELGQPLVVMASAGGTPLKLDFGGVVYDAREGVLDYFGADTDTSRGSSGAGAFDDELVLSGVLARGGEDFIETDSGCLTTRREAGGGDVQEEFTYVHQALAGLCEDGASTSSLCRPDCGDPCEALPARSSRADGCALSPGAHGGARGAAGGLVSLLLGACLLRRKRARSAQRTGDEGEAASVGSGATKRFSGGPR
jgi:trypsin-like peptidase